MTDQQIAQRFFKKAIEYAQSNFEINVKEDQRTGRASERTQVWACSLSNLQMLQSAMNAEFNHKPGEK